MVSFNRSPVPTSRGKRGEKGEKENLERERGKRREERGKREKETDLNQEILSSVSVNVSRDNQTLLDTNLNS